MKKSSLWGIACYSLLNTIILVNTAHGALVLDNQYDPLSDSGSEPQDYLFADNEAPFHAQVFTVNTTGILASIEILIGADANFLFELFPANAGAPDPPLNWASRVIGFYSIETFSISSTGTDLGWWGADISTQNIHVNAGDQFSIIVRFSSSASGIGRWVGSDSSDALLFPDKHYTSTEGRSFRLGSPSVMGFRVYVEPVPVPPSLWLFGTGLISLVGIARRKKS